MAVLTCREAIRQAMEQEMERDRRVFILGEDVGNYGGAFRVTQGFLEKFGPERIIDTPISETGLIGAAIGASLFGMRPIAELQFIDFIACGFNQIVNYAAKSRYRWGGGVPIVIRGPAGAGVHGGPLPSPSAPPCLMNAPGLKIGVPAPPAPAKGPMIPGIRDPDPVIFLEHKFLYRRLKEDVPEGDYVTPIGEARIARSGDDVSILTYGAMVHASMDAAEIVAGEGVSVEILDLRTLLPMDREAILATVRRTGRALIGHEPTETGGPGGEIPPLIAEHAFLDLDAPVVRVAPPDTAVPYSPPLEEFVLPNAAKIAEAIRALARY